MAVDNLMRAAFTANLAQNPTTNDPILSKLLQPIHNAIRLLQLENNILPSYSDTDRLKLQGLKAGYTIINTTSKAINYWDGVAWRDCSGAII